VFQNLQLHCCSFKLGFIFSELARRFYALRFATFIELQPSEKVKNTLWLLFVGFSGVTHTDSDSIG